MIRPSISAVMAVVGNKYTLCMIAAKRARQLAEGAPKLTDCNSDKPVTIAAYEISENRLSYESPHKSK